MSGLESHAGSSRLGQVFTSGLDSRLEPLGGFLAVSWRFLRGLSLARVLESRSGLGLSRLVNNTSLDYSRLFLSSLLSPDMAIAPHHLFSGC